MFKLHLRSVPMTAALFVCLGALSGCASLMTTTSDSAQLDIQATANSIYEGEIVTVVTRSMNTLGSKATIQWTTTGGKADEEQNGRVYRVKFDTAGHYVITARLTVDGQVVDSDQVEIKVRQLVDYANNNNNR